MVPEANWAQPVAPVDPAADKAAADAREAAMAEKQRVADLNALAPAATDMATTPTPEPNPSGPVENDEESTE